MVLTEIAAAVAGAIVTQIVNFGYNRWRSKNVALNEWYNQAISLTSHGHSICESTKTRSDLNYGSLSEESKKISERLNEHVNPYAKGADEESVARISTLSKMFSKLHSIAETSDEKPTMETLDELIQMASRESKSAQGVDMGDAIVESTQYSPIMSSLLKEIQLNPRRFGPQLRSDIEKAESLQDLVESMGPEYGVSEKRVENLIEKMTSGEDWDQTLSHAIRITLQIVSNLSLETINHLSEVSDKGAASGS